MPMLSGNLPCTPLKSNLRTPTKEYEDIARKTQELTSILESSDDAILGKTLDGIITSWNRGAEKLYGYRSSEIIGKSVLKLYPKDHLYEFDEIMDVIRLGESVDHHQTSRQTKDGRLIDVSVTISPIFNSQDQIVGVSTIARDISEIRELERRKDAFIGMTSHELKTPITTLKAYIQILRKQFKGDSPGDSKKYLQKMEDQIDRLTDLVTDLLDLSKIQAGKLSLNKAKFDLDELVSEVTEDLQKITTTHQLVIEGEVGRKILGDRHRIGQILINLISNAIKYSPSVNRVIIASYSDNHKVVISVQDFGIGISKRHQKRIFDRFFRAEGSSEKTFPGLGIGLYITSELVKRHGGQIWVDSTKGKGSIFSVCLPFE